MLWRPLAQFARFGGVSLLMGMVGCGVTTVRQVQEHPTRNWFNSTVQLKGTIGDRAPLIGAQVYQLQDETGTIWVLTTDTNLRSGERVVVQGKVLFQSIPIEGQEYGEVYIQELQREVK
ncbi:MAG: hypothetical protein HC769_11090 [Cyanobacteria bacterium CRU_2_1]|nr:hypothetical protein [Cyanobacteria bacterium RU_5_0]NJR59338.1 hypothetical protein [Cyanobacteria bacterium CRU_2_1]